MQAASSTLDQVKQQLVAAQEVATKQQAAADAAAKRTAARQQQRLAASAQALGTAVGLLLSCMATMAAAAGVLQHSMQSMTQQQLMLDVRGSCSFLADCGGVGALAARNLTQQPSQQAVQSQLNTAAAETGAAGLADMVCLSGEELADLLGPGDDTCRMLLLELQQQQQQEAALDQQQQQQQQELACGGNGAAASGVALVQRVKQGGTQALLELEAGEGGSQRQQQLLQQLAEVVSQLSSSSSSNTASSSSGAGVGFAAGSGSSALDAAGVAGGSGGSSGKGGRGAGGGGGSKQCGGGNGVCVLQGLHCLLQLLTQDVGAQQGMLRAAVCVCAAACC